MDKSEFIFSHFWDFQTWLAYSTLHFQRQVEQANLHYLPQTEHAFSISTAYDDK